MEGKTDLSPQLLSRDGGQTGGTDKLRKAV